MSQQTKDRVVVAGHICIDIIPTIEKRTDDSEAFLLPGQLIHVGPAILATGGAVSNTGLALHRLGVPTRLVGKIGKDLFGSAILDVIRSRDPALTEGMVVSEDVASSYTIVITPRGRDRSFLHCPGANDSFGPEDVDIDALADAAIFHFGYPPLMRRMFSDGGHELTAMLRNVHAAGIATSLDLAHIDLGSEAGEVDWRELLRMALREVDLFVPSLDEVFPILQPQRYQQAVAAGDGDFMRGVDVGLLGELADELLRMGAAVVYLKMGAQGIYLRTTTNADRLQRIPSLSLDETWLGRELIAPAYEVELVGTNGAGDCAIAGFFAGLVRGQLPEDALISGVAAGGANVERADASSGVPPWEALQARIAAGWRKLPLSIDTSDWRYRENHGLWASPRDAQFARNLAQQ